MFQRRLKRQVDEMKFWITNLSKQNSEYVVKFESMQGKIIELRNEVFQLRLENASLRKRLEDTKDDI